MKNLALRFSYVWVYELIFHFHPTVLFAVPFDFSFKITTKVAANWTFLDGSVLFCWTPAVQTLKCFTTFCSYQRLSSFYLEIAWNKAPVSAEQQSGESKEDQNIDRAGHWCFLGVFLSCEKQVRVSPVPLLNWVTEFCFGLWRSFDRLLFISVRLSGDSSPLITATHTLSETCACYCTLHTLLFCSSVCERYQTIDAWACVYFPRI